MVVQRKQLLFMHQLHFLDVHIYRITFTSSVRIKIGLSIWYAYKLVNELISTRTILDQVNRNIVENWSLIYSLLNFLLIIIILAVSPAERSQIRRERELKNEEERMRVLISIVYVHPSPSLSKKKIISQYSVIISRRHLVTKGKIKKN